MRVDLEDAVEAAEQALSMLTPRSGRIEVDRTQQIRVSQGRSSLARFYILVVCCDLRPLGRLVWHLTARQA